MARQETIAVNDDFREEIEYLADRAGEERARIADEARPSPLRRPLRKFVIFGAVIAVLEVLLLVYQSSVETQELSTHYAPNPLLTQQDCVGERYRVSRAILAYMQANQTAPPSLDALVPEYLPKTPVDPITKLPLIYKKLKRGSQLDCPPVPAAR
jgi:hypothetical protein